MSGKDQKWKSKAMIFAVLSVAVAALWAWSSIESFSSLSSLNRIRRGIASDAIRPEERSNKLSRPVTMKWNLSERSLEKEVDGTHLRIKGLVKNLKADSITNETNGFTASVFLTGREFTTDFIELKEGKNQIQVRLTSGKGKKISKKIEIIRRLPASVEPAD